MPRMHPLLRSATAFALLLVGLTACNPDRADAPRDVPNPSLPKVEPAASTTQPRPDTSPAPPTVRDAPPAEPQTRVPAAYLGEWQRTGTSCASRDETRLRMEARRVTFHESSGDVLAAAQDGDRLTLTLRMTGEGETRDATYRFGLSNDRRWLTDLDSDLVRERCP